MWSENESKLNDVVENILQGKLCNQCQNDLMGKLIARKIM